VTIVVDASVLVDLLLGAPTVTAGRDRRVRGERRRVTLDLADLEVMSSLRRRLSSRRITAATADAAVAALATMPIRRLRSTPLRKRIWELRPSHAPYDAAYVALAERLGLPLVTTDRRLARSHGHRAEIIDLSG
jgi:predicted nucleic acid-binding protein